MPYNSLPTPVLYKTAVVASDGTASVSLAYPSPNTEVLCTLLTMQASSSPVATAEVYVPGNPVPVHVPLYGKANQTGGIVIPAGDAITVRLVGATPGDTFQAGAVVTPVNLPLVVPPTPNQLIPSNAYFNASLPDVAQTIVVTPTSTAIFAITVTLAVAMTFTITSSAGAIIYQANSTGNFSVDLGGVPIEGIKITYTVNGGYVPENVTITYA